MDAGPSAVSLGGQLKLTIDPGKPVSGRDTTFLLEGLEPWTLVTVGFVDPSGAAAQWVTDYEVQLRDAHGAATTSRLIADGSGAIRWTRIGTEDLPGAWTLRMVADNFKSEVTYTLVDLPVQGGDTLEVGIPMRRYAVNGSEAYYGEGVPVGLVVDLQEFLAWAQGHVRDRYGLGIAASPVVHLTRDHETLVKVGKAIDQDVGWEAGFYIGGGARPGIYMRTDTLATSARMLLTHEYAHLLIDGIDGEGSLPPWLDEGIAVYLESEVTLQAGRPVVPRRNVYEDMSLVRAEARAGTLIPLASLQSREDWNSETDEEYVRRQYAQSHAAVRYLAERFGFKAVVDTVRRIGAGETLEVALQSATGETYAAMESGLAQWIAAWEAPERAAARTYMQALDALLIERDQLVDRRSALIEGSQPLGQQREGMRQVVADLAGLVARVETTPHPPALGALRDEAVTDVRTVHRWLSLELQYLETRNAAFLDQANAMLPEVNGRNNRLTRSVSDVAFAYLIDD